ncbi:L-seryl-tRNA(Sec) selenium transferase [Streptomyces anthocyanicus]|uniref:L-seryl-tRNA(Sec) selenium transferase n=1 Tax=Streptomyces anthocyanicus TaxID=68174 RepID=UPI002F90C986|nr:L-seryl-tRNA(Sec) selenium transferase [Streptomyces anthocyanicus]
MEPPAPVHRRVPRTDAVLAESRLVEAARRLGPALVKQAVHRAQDQVRAAAVPPEGVVDAAVALLPEYAMSLRPVLNATGIVLHTNLGRAPLSAQARAAVEAAAGHVDVEYNIVDGRRDRRGRGALEALSAAVPDAGDAHVVNNGAAALALAATVLAQGREIVVSRGELIEIGDGFRLPDLLVSTGARLREVGTTNRTHLADYRDALSLDTAFILKIHPSNFRLEGFTSSVPVSDLAGLGVPVVGDIGSGLLHPDPLLPDEPDAATWLRQGADLVTASGDKLLGGPQAGLLLGSAPLVERLRCHPLARALRVDKLALAALEATLRGPEPPVHRALHTDPALLRARSTALADRLTVLGVTAGAVPHDGAVGGGGAPGQRLAGWAVRLCADLADPLRRGRPSVVGHTTNGALLLDLRCVPEERDDDLITAAVAAARAAGCPETCPAR